MDLDISVQDLSRNYLHNSISDYLLYDLDNLSIKKFRVLQVNMRSIRDLSRFDILKKIIDDRIL